MKLENIKIILILISIPIAVICIIMPLTEFTGVTKEEATAYIEQLGYPQYPTRLNIEMTEFVNNISMVYINNTGDCESYRPNIKIQHPSDLEFWIYPVEYNGTLCYKFKDVYNYLSSDNDGDIKERLYPGESWNFFMEFRGDGNGICKLIASENVLGGWGYQGNCMYGEITHIKIEEYIADEIEFEVENGNNN